MHLPLSFSKKLSLLTLLICTLHTSCEGTNEIDLISPSGNKLPQKIDIYFSNDRGNSFSPAYEAVKIGEYYWMSSNFYHITDHLVTRSDIDKIITINRQDASEFKISMSDFHKYYGSYYSRRYIEDLTNHGQMYEGEEKKLQHNWDLPYAADFRQLFGMCGSGDVYDVMTFLGCKVGDNPGAIFVKGSAWVRPLNRNIYGFSLLPTGAVFNGETTWTPHWGEEPVHSKGGDMYALLQAVVFPAHGGITVSIHDYPDTNGAKLWHYMPMRWCRKLTDEELGYKLYINQAKTDILKLKLKDNPPRGYTELEKGYIRGFYVQYILDNPQPQKTVTQIVEMAKNLR